jgi:hypothetical protein
VNQTSIIVVPIFTISRRSNIGFPVAMITMSEVDVYFFISGVLLLQIITVAHAFISKAASGFHTILLLPTITTCFPATFSQITSSIYITPAGVHGAKPESSHIKTFQIFSG